ncbi:hypothetical protein D6C97_09797 [Aureobasidium pullulans]|uniref:Uncharacterized protein n=1 Tax=Aureobasidium pullulans TaxID=5580 RepID=A0A4S9Y3N9_AURPU|nr:hypothetical protein D6C97_09797 [Aureobasidium pullulans]THZ86427.1 hypothetical protein D6C83_09455 [Aureobasidium pullulans]
MLHQITEHLFTSQSCPIGNQHNPCAQKHYRLFPRPTGYLTNDICYQGRYKQCSKLTLTVGCSSSLYNTHMLHSQMLGFDPFPTISL